MEVTTHCDLLKLHIDLPKQIIRRYFLICISQQPALSKKFESKTLSLVVSRLIEEDAGDCLVELHFQKSFEYVVVVIAFIEALEGTIEVVK